MIASGQKRLSAILLFAFLGLVFIGAVGISLASGSSGIGFGPLGDVLAGGGSDMQRMVILELRLPRILSAIAVGGLLALAGTLMQVLLRNPLADPYILGVSGGAAVGALLVMLTGLAGLAVGGGAFAGALVSTLLVFALSHGEGGWTPTRLLLTGVVIAAGWSAVISLLLALGDDSSLRGMLFWLMGDLSYRGGWQTGLAILVLSGLLSLPFARHLNVLSRGETLAELLGISVRPFKIGIYLVASLLTAVAVTLAGSIGFVGLVVPHMLRLVGGSDHRVVVPGSMLLGASLVVLADTLARTVIAPRQLPVGVLMAMLGVPVFLYLLHRARGPL